MVIVARSKVKVQLNVTLAHPVMKMSLYTKSETRSSEIARTRCRSTDTWTNRQTNRWMLIPCPRLITNDHGWEKLATHTIIFQISISNKERSLTFMFSENYNRHIWYPFICKRLLVEYCIVTMVVMWWQIQIYMFSFLRIQFSLLVNYTPLTTIAIIWSLISVSYNHLWLQNELQVFHLLTLTATGPKYFPTYTVPNPPLPSILEVTE